jgi:Ni/Fe-hydrogenase subunit HybB-like protein
MTLLTAIALVGANAWAVQVRDGMGVTAMSDHVSWGLYIANFTFFVGVAAGAVMMVIPAYLYHDEQPCTTSSSSGNCSPSPPSVSA